MFALRLTTFDNYTIYIIFLLLRSMAVSGPDPSHKKADSLSYEDANAVVILSYRGIASRIFQSTPVITVASLPSKPHPRPSIWQTRHNSQFPHPKEGDMAYPTTNSSPCLKHCNTSALHSPIANPTPTHPTQLTQKKEKSKTHPPQIPHPLIQPRRKHIPHIAKHTLMRFDAQLLADIHDDGFEAAVCRGVEDARFELGGCAYGLEADFYCGGLMLGILGLGKGSWEYEFRMRGIEREKNTEFGGWRGGGWFEGEGARARLG